jgi:riboflavin biosynthesis pyrimidine reductase
MADTGENRQISGRANAKQAETIRTSKEMVSEGRSTAEASNAAFTNKGPRRRTKGGGQRSPDPDVPKT